MVGLELRLEAEIAEVGEASRAWAIGTLLTTLLGMAGSIVAIILVEPRPDGAGVTPRR